MPLHRLFKLLASCAGEEVEHRVESEDPEKITVDAARWPKGPPSQAPVAKFKWNRTRIN
jgi:hypothetical protein